MKVGAGQFRLEYDVNCDFPPWFQSLAEQLFVEVERQLAELPIPSVLCALLVTDALRVDSPQAAILQHRPSEHNRVILVGNSTRSKCAHAPHTTPHTRARAKQPATTLQQPQGEG